MTTTTTARTLALSISFALTAGLACAGDETPREVVEEEESEFDDPRDAGRTGDDDAGAPAPEPAPTPGLDGGAPEPAPGADGGTPGPVPDAGPGLGEDAGAPEEDAGTPSPDPGPADFDANFLWTPIVLDGAPDLGFSPGPIPAGDQVAPGAVTLDERGLLDGLADAVGDGNAHGVGVGFVDVNNDGWDDLFIINGSQAPSKLFMNGGGTFSDGTTTAGLANLFATLDGYSIAAADYDADGDVDVYLGARPTDILLRNDGDGTFTDVTTAAGAGGPSVNQPGSASKIVSFGDYDGDGYMDLVSSYASSEQQGDGYLLHNDGDGTFTDATAAMAFAPSSSGNPCATLWTDYDNDGDQDLFIWNDRGGNRTNRTLLRNDGNTFVDVREAANITDNIGNPMGIDSADLNRDGFLDYYVSDIGNNPLYLGSADGTFTNVASAAGVTGEYGWGLGFEDFNHDTWTDIFIAQEDNRDYLLFVHDGAVPPTFTETRWGHSAVASSAHNVAVAFADYDHDGRTDIVTATTDGSRVQLFRNTTATGTARWLEVRVIRAPALFGRGGVSGRVVVKAGDLVQFRDLAGGSSRASQNAHSIRFGLGQVTGADWVAVVWPDGRQLVVKGVEGNRVLELAAP